MTFDTLTQGRAASRIVSGTKTIATAGTAVQVVTASTPCHCIWLSGDIGNSDIIVVGDSSVVAAYGTQQGIVLVSGNQSICLELDDLNKLWVNSVSNGDELCYAYLASVSSL